MNSGKSIEKLYQIINEILGPIEAKSFVCEILSIAISDLQEQSLPITSEALDELLAIKAVDFIEASKNRVA